MNILNIIMSVNTIKGGGSVERILKLHKNLNEIEGVDSQILSINSDHELQSEFSENEITQLPCWNKRWYIPIPRLKVVKDLILWADVVHIMNHWTFINAWAYLLVRIFKKPYIVCPAGALTIYGRSKILKKLYHYFIGHRLIKNASAGIVISEDEIELLIKEGLSLSKIHHVPNGVSETDFIYENTSLFRKKMGINDVPYILYIGRLNIIKGPDILLEAYLQLESEISHHLIFVGPDEGLKNHLESILDKYKSENRVHFLDYAGGDLKSSAYHGAEILVVPSRQEAMSIVALEAAVTSTPVLLSDKCGFSALAEAGGAIEVSPDIDDMKKKLLLLINSPEKLKDMGSAGKIFVQKNYTWSNITQKYLNIFSSIMNNAN